MAQQPNQSRTNPGKNSRMAGTPNDLPEVEQPERQMPTELPEHQVQAQSGGKKQPAGEPTIPERRGQPEREAPPAEDEGMEKRMDSQKDDPVEGQNLH